MPHQLGDIAEIIEQIRKCIWNCSFFLIKYFIEPCTDNVAPDQAILYRKQRKTFNNVSGANVLEESNMGYDTYKFPRLLIQKNIDGTYL